ESTAARGTALADRVSEDALLPALARAHASLASASVAALAAHRRRPRPFGTAGRHVRLSAGVTARDEDAARVRRSSGIGMRSAAGGVSLGLRERLDAVDIDVQHDGDDGGELNTAS